MSTKDPDSTPWALWQAGNGHAATSLAAGSFAMRQPERGQKTAPTPQVAYVSVGARHPATSTLPANKIINSAERSR